MTDSRKRRIAENEAIWRQINELAPPEPGSMSSVFCECGRTDCAEHITVTAQEYERARASTTTFVVTPGHEYPEVEQVVARTDRHLLVEKHGVAAAVVNGET
jgi:hypothetical protein